MKLHMAKLNEKEIGSDKLLYIPLSFLLPAVIILIAVITLQVVPFGEHSLLISDGQFAPNGMAFFNRLLHGQENAFYSFKNGLGNNEWSVLSWGGISPAMLLTYFATQETIPVLFTWMVVVNMALCGLTMYLLLAAVRGHRLSNLLFSTSYALMGFNTAYFMHTGFFIGPQLLPLMVWGMIHIIRGKSPLLYVLSLAACIFLNFYFGFMLCVSSAVLFGAYIYTNPVSMKGKMRTTILRWIVSSVIAGFLAAPMWLPALKAFTGGSRIDQALMIETTFSENMPFIQIFSKLFSGANSQAQEVDGLPNIFCGILVVGLVFLYFMNREIPKRRKRAAGFILGFYLLTFYIQAFTKLMHGGTHTNWFNFRYSFVFSFLLICIAAEEFKYIRNLTRQQAKHCGIALLVTTIVVMSVQYEFLSGGAVVMDLALLIVMWLMVRIHQKNNKVTEKVLAGLLLLAVSVNLFANLSLSILSIRDWEKDLTLYKANVLFSGSSVDALKKYDTGFFRMEKDVSESESLGVDALLYGYNGVSYSGPAVRMFVHKELNKLGVNWYDMRHWYQAGVPAATDALLGLKYILASRTDIGEEKDYPRIVATEENAIYQNPNSLGVAILANHQSIDLELGSNVFENLNAVWKSMTGGDKGVFAMQEDVNFTLRNPADISVTREVIQTSASQSTGEQENELSAIQDNAYIEIEFPAEHTGAVYRCDTSVPESEWGKTSRTMKYIGYFKEGETVKDYIETNSSYVPRSMFLDYCAHIAYASADNAALAAYAEVLNGRDVTFNAERETDLTGTFTASEGQNVLFTIPWDEGWTAYIDGQKVPINKTWDLFMSIDAPEGQHTYELKFFPAWMNYGLNLCGAAFVGLVVLMIVWKRKNKSVPAAISEQVQIEQSAESSQLD